MRERWLLLVPEYRHKGRLDVLYCGSYKVLEVLNRGKNGKLDIPARFDGLCIFNRDSIKAYIHRERQPVWEFLMPPVKTGASPRLIRTLARLGVGCKKRRTFLYRSELDAVPWSWELSKPLDEDPLP